MCVCVCIYIHIYIYTYIYIYIYHIHIYVTHTHTHYRSIYSLGRPYQPSGFTSDLHSKRRCLTRVRNVKSFKSQSCKILARECVTPSCYGRSGGTMAPAQMKRAVWESSDYGHCFLIKSLSTHTHTLSLSLSPCCSLSLSLSSSLFLSLSHTLSPLSLSLLSFSPLSLSLSLSDHIQLSPRCKIQHVRPILVHTKWMATRFSLPLTSLCRGCLAPNVDSVVLTSTLTLSSQTKPYVYYRHTLLCELASCSGGSG